ncbi:hypothetical protein CJF32_00004569 [Rutstroemia sp. NJR-2017a WRK4]|nr:hypothetical protein CJF32_00004569 [Rutstroemia sp. NJR-2017a WRK4]
MSLPPELRILCLRLTSTSPADLPELTPTLVQYVSRCRVALSAPSVNSVKADAPQSSVMVHKLKTQLTTLLNGKSAEGRFAAVVLIKAVVEVGGWEVLRDAGSWVRGLLSVLGKPDSSATKQLCIVALTKIYCMTHQYQTLIREITTPTLPTFITSCLNAISSKSSRSDVCYSLVETAFRSFTTLLPRHTTIFRPFASQLRVVTRPYLAPTVRDGAFIPASLKESARRLVVVLHQTVPKNGGGEEWGKAVRDLIKDIHVTADQVFRAVVEDWESNAGYIAETVNVNEESSGGAQNPDDLPSWTGIDAGIERLVGLLALLQCYLQGPTAAAVTIPLGSLFDLVTRLLSVSLPMDSGSGSVRLHPAIDRDERDGLWTGLPQILISALQISSTISDVLGHNFMPMAQGSLDLLVWSFPSGKHNANYRAAAYGFLTKVLSLVGQTLDKPRTTKLVPLMRACCKDLDKSSLENQDSNMNKSQVKGASSQNADTLLQGSIVTAVVVDPAVVAAASALLPVLLSHLPQRYLDISMRSLVERTAILGQNKEAMLASILNPFVGRNGKTLSSILPHITREYAHDDVVEILLRPRMPMIPSKNTQTYTEDGDMEDDNMEDGLEIPLDENTPLEGIAPEHSILQNQGLASSTTAPITSNTQQGFGVSVPVSARAVSPPSISLPNVQPAHDSVTTSRADTIMTYENADEDSDSESDTSVHLTMQLDSSDSE